MMSRTILIIEDDRDIRESLAEILEAEGYATARATNGQEGLDYLRSAAKPNLILLDLMMPVKDGYDFANELVRDPRISDIPVIVMSADGSVLKKGTIAKADEWVRKPIDLEEFLEAIQRHIT
jgi:two-component system, chemotaxis family, chemotaxis protein CheY